MKKIILFVCAAMIMASGSAFALVGIDDKVDCQKLKAAIDASMKQQNQGSDMAKDKEVQKPVESAK